MDINMITEPKWKSYIVQTNDAIFTPEQCKMIIDAGRNEPKQDAYVGGDKKIKSGIIDTKTRTSHISWIPFSKMEGMYKDIEKLMKATNKWHNIQNTQKVGFMNGMLIMMLILFMSHRLEKYL